MIGILAMYPKNRPIKTGIKNRLTRKIHNSISSAEIPKKANLEFNLFCFHLRDLDLGNSIRKLYQFRTP